MSWSGLTFPPCFKGRALHHSSTLPHPLRGNLFQFWFWPSAETGVLRNLCFMFDPITKRETFATFSHLPNLIPTWRDGKQLSLAFMSGQKAWEADTYCEGYFLTRGIGCPVLPGMVLGCITAFHVIWNRLLLIAVISVSIDQILKMCLLFWFYFWPVWQKLCTVSIILCYLYNGVYGFTENWTQVRFIFQSLNPLRFSKGKQQKEGNVERLLWSSCTSQN